MIELEGNACGSGVPAHGGEGAAERRRDVGVNDTLQP
jgi:hypothetical protein